MRNIRLFRHRYTIYGTVYVLTLLDSKFEADGEVSLKVQALDYQGRNLGPVQDFKGNASDPDSLFDSANSLAAVHFGAGIAIKQV